MARIISLLNQKGGVGKTTTARTMGSGLVDRGKKVLIIDLDPQANSTTSLGVGKRALKTTVGNLLKEEKFEIISTNDGVDLIPANIRLATTELDIISSMGREGLLKEGLEAIKDNYDYILIDCPPSLSILTINALTASTEIIVPVNLAKFSIEGLTDLMDTYKRVKKKINHNLKKPRVLITKYSPSRTTFEKYAAGLNKIFGDNLFNTRIRENATIEKAHENETSIFKLSPRSNGSKDYNKFIDEYLELEEKNG